MDAAKRHAARVQLIAGMRRGQPWQEAAKAAGLQISQATAYRLLRRVRTERESALHDGRHGHASKLREPIRQWLEVYCRASPACPSRTVQTTLYERLGVWISITHLTRVRAAGSEQTPPRARGKNQPQSAPEPSWQEGAGSLLWLATPEGALPTGGAVPSRLAQATPRTRRQSLLTLLFLPAVGCGAPTASGGWSGSSPCSFELVRPSR